MRVVEVEAGQELVPADLAVVVLVQGVEHMPQLAQLYKKEREKNKIVKTTVGRFIFLSFHRTDGSGRLLRWARKYGGNLTPGHVATVPILFLWQPSRVGGGAYVARRSLRLCTPASFVYRPLDM